MDAERWQRIRTLFGAALERSPDELSAWLAAECGEDSALREEILSLLAAHREGGDLLPEPPLPPLSDPLAGQRLGPYEVRQRLGGGGMGVVYLALRVDGQFKKRVALKVLKPGMDSEEILRRFRTERQILAALEHPNIARLLDGGTTDRGLPYFVMEYVEGSPITGYCDRENLSIPERLRLFRTVCSAVQFAHQSLVVHRDLKPGNILVGTDGTPKLLDFGIAKLLNADLSSQTMAWTAIGTQPFTPDYASPEQVRGGHITTASDVYSLGVLLYELLTGHHPYGDQGCTTAEMMHRITEVEPERPSNRAQRLGGRRLARQLAGDLDTIVMTALRKEPHHRYTSVEQLSEDVRRFLEGLPVLARKATFTYRLRKLALRHRLGAAVAATAVLAVVLFGAGMAGLALRLARERSRAEQERARAEQVTGFLTDLFEVSDPSRATGETVSARSLLDASARKIETDLKDQPEAQADLMETMGMIYRRLGLLDRALPLVESALARRQHLLGPDHPKVAQSFNDLGLLHEDKGEYDLAATQYRQALDLRRRSFGPSHPEVAQSLSDLAGVLWAQGDYDAAEKGFREVLAMRRKLFGDHHLEVAKSLNNLGVILWSRGRYDEAEQPLREALAIRRQRLGEVNLEVADIRSNLALVVQAQGRYTEAERLERDVIGVQRKLLDPEHPRLADSLNNLGFLLEVLGRYKEAAPLLDEALVIRRRRLGESHPKVAESLHNLGFAAQGMGDLRAAESYHRSALAIRRGVFGEKHRTVADSLGQIAAVLQSQGRPEAAEALWRQALAIRQEVLGRDHPETAATLSDLAALLTAGRRLAEAERLAREAVRLLASRQPGNVLENATAQSVLGGCLAAGGRFDEAEPLLTASYASLRAALGDEAQPAREAHKRLVDLYRAKAAESSARGLPSR
jgi:serine/threonine protein kinase/tetratricopeptide (TPR) repeat protein